MKQRFWTSKGALLLIDGLICATVTLGLVKPLFYDRGIDPGWMPVLAGALLSSALVLLLSLRWWILPAIVLFVGLPGFFILVRLELLNDWAQALIRFLTWAGQRLILGGPEPEFSFWLIILRLLISICVSAILYTLIHRFSHLFLTALFVLPGIILFLIAHPSAVAQVLPAMAGLMALMPASLVQYVKKQEPQAAIPRAPLQWLALPVALISVWMGLWLTPEDTSRWQQQDWVNRFYDLRDFFQNQTGLTRSWQPFDLALAGFQSSEKQLGGPIRPSDQVFIDVKAEDSVLLRGVTRTLYEKNRWRSPPHQVYRLDSPLWRLTKRQVFVEDLPAGAEGRRFKEQYTRQLTLELSPRTRTQTTIFSAGRLEALSWPDSRDYPPYFTIDGDLFVFKSLPPNPTYQITVTLWERSKPGFNEAINLLSTSPVCSRDPYWAAVSSRYLQLPDDLPLVVRETAKQLTASGTSPYEKAVLLEHYLMEQGIYTLEPEDPPEGMDFVASFLREKSGYCVHFATAMTVMARAIGLPARYVEGFALEAVNGSENAFRATGKTAHAWCEIYLQGIGWLTFDPTPPGRENPPEEPPLPTEEPTPTPEKPTAQPTPPPLEPTPQKASGTGWLILFCGLLLVVLLFHFFFHSITRQYLHHLRPLAMHRHFPDPAICLDVAYQDILHQFSLIDVCPETGETLSAFAQRANHYLRFENMHLSDLFWPVIRWRYGQKEPTPAEVDALLDLRIRLDDRLRENFSKTAWFLKRVWPGYRFIKNQRKLYEKSQSK